MFKDEFAKHMGFADYAEMYAASCLLKRVNDTCWFCARTAQGYVVWLDKKCYCQRGNSCQTLEEARRTICGQVKQGRLQRLLNRAPNIHSIA